MTRSIRRYIVAVYLIWLGGAVAWSSVASGAVSQFPKIGLSSGAVGYTMIFAGCMMLFVRSLRMQLLYTLAHLPLTIAAFLLLADTHIWQSLAVYTFAQLAMPSMLIADALKRSE